MDPGEGMGTRPKSVGPAHAQSHSTLMLCWTGDQVSSECRSSGDLCAGNARLQMRHECSWQLHAV
jgi:hypothetical protein